MPLYHIVLFRLKPGVTDEQKAEVTKAAKAMVGQIPGLISVDVNEPVALTRTKGFNMGIVGIMESAKYLDGYAAHPAHLSVHKLREALCEDTLAFDMEF